MSASIRLGFIVRRTNCGCKARRRATTIAESQQQDLERTLLYTLRIAFVGALRAKALLARAKENLDYFEKELSINRVRYQADIARVDRDRLLLQALPSRRWRRP